MGEPAEDDDVYDDYDGPEEIGCYECGHSGWRHGCMDDMCRSRYEPEDCPDAIPCRHPLSPLQQGRGERPVLTPQPIREARET